MPVDGYIIEMASGDSQEFKQIGRVDSNTCYFDAVGLTNGEKYNFRIRTQNPSGISEGFAQLDEPLIAEPSCGERSAILLWIDQNMTTYTTALAWFFC